MSASKHVSSDPVDEPSAKRRKSNRNSSAPSTASRSAVPLTQQPDAPVFGSTQPLTDDPRNGEELHVSSDRLLRLDDSFQVGDESVDYGPDTEPSSPVTDTTPAVPLSSAWGAKVKGMVQGHFVPTVVAAGHSATPLPPGAGNPASNDLAQVISPAAVPSTTRSLSHQTSASFNTASHPPPTSPAPSAGYQRAAPKESATAGCRRLDQNVEFLRADTASRLAGQDTILTDLRQSMARLSESVEKLSLEVVSYGKERLSGDARDDLSGEIAALKESLDDSVFSLRASTATKTEVEEAVALILSNIPHASTTAPLQASTPTPVQKDPAPINSSRPAPPAAEPDFATDEVVSFSTTPAAPARAQSAKNPYESTEDPGLCQDMSGTDTDVRCPNQIFGSMSEILPDI
ncbi:hypothetical protein SISNIDRAFT_471566 [Sistotremastrum niveocremeum HHB9708]|uniref:Uncharacterized protein n=1 Tax=Sistotremastrum niveocremeum HHB9708 TaxID=1314777 RepID=A0A164MGG5_9AGAM|nr:hypothetical protein SISNIDRAFT_471566 [Sistotremastrum niveocremeum HHB9708]